MHLFTIKIADHLIQAETLHVRSKNMCRDFLSEGTPEVSIRMEQRDIDEMKKHYANMNRESPSWDGVLETIALHAKVSDSLIPYGVFMMHGAAVAYGGGAYIFTGRSGIGKTTHVMKWLEHLPDAFMVNGDKPFIQTDSGGTPPLACGSPWAGKESLYANAAVPLKAIVQIERAEENRMEQISFAQAFPAFLAQVHRPEDEEKMRLTLQWMQRVGSAVSFWRFRCNNFKDDCFDVAFNALIKGQS